MTPQPKSSPAQPTQGNSVRIIVIPSKKVPDSFASNRFEPDVMVVQIGSLAGWVRDACRDYGYTCEVANTSSEAWKFKHVKRRPQRGQADDEAHRGSR